MKSVMISIKPKWCELIASGKKTVEVRKSRPKIETPFKCYIYETKGKTEVLTFIDEEGHEIYEGRGQVIGWFICDFAELITFQKTEEDGIEFEDYISESLTKDACLSIQEALEYANGKPLYGWHISDLVIYDKPKELSDFSSGSSTLSFSKTKDGLPWKYSGMTRPFQSWGYVEELEQ